MLPETKKGLKTHDEVKVATKADLNTFWGWIKKSIFFILILIVPFTFFKIIYGIGLPITEKLLYQHFGVNWLFVVSHG